MRQLRRYLPICLLQSELREYAERLERYEVRLETATKLQEAEGVGAASLKVEDYRELREANLLELARDMAADERFSALEVLFHRHRGDLGRSILQVTVEEGQTSRSCSGDGRELTTSTHIWSSSLITHLTAH